MVLEQQPNRAIKLYLIAHGKTHRSEVTFVKSATRLLPKGQDYEDMRQRTQVRGHTFAKCATRPLQESHT